MTAPLRLAVLGHPLRYTLSPELHRAGARAVGRECESFPMRVEAERVGSALAWLWENGFDGCNLTMPLKEAAIPFLRSMSDAARIARSVNTVTITDTGRHGDTTDGVGFVDVLASLERPAAGTRVLLLGAGGAARSLAGALVPAGARLRVMSRQRPEPEPVWGGAPEWHEWGSLAAVSDADVIVNATPLGADALEPLLAAAARRALVVDLTYGETLTPWVLAARARGLEAVDGLGLLVHQARHSLTHWLGCEVPLPPLAAAVGWPR